MTPSLGGSVWPLTAKTELNLPSTAPLRAVKMVVQVAGGHAPGRQRHDRNEQGKDPKVMFLQLGQGDFDFVHDRIPPLPRDVAAAGYLFSFFTACRSLADVGFQQNCTMKGNLGRRSFVLPRRVFLPPHFGPARRRAARPLRAGDDRVGIVDHFGFDSSRIDEHGVADAQVFQGDGFRFAVGGGDFDFSGDEVPHERVADELAALRGTLFVVVMPPLDSDDPAFSRRSGVGASRGPARQGRVGLAGRRPRGAARRERSRRGRSRRRLAQRLIPLLHARRTTGTGRRPAGSRCS